MLPCSRIVQTVARFFGALAELQCFLGEELEGALEEGLYGGGGELGRVGDATGRGPVLLGGRGVRGIRRKAVGGLAFRFQEEGAELGVAFFVESGIAQDGFFGGAGGGEVEQETLFVLTFEVRAGSGSRGSSR